MKTPRRLFIGLSLVAMLAACADRSSSTIAEGAAAEPPWTGVVVVSQQLLPSGAAHKVLGTVQAESGGGYKGAATLHPLLADEARKIGANGVVGVTGSRELTATSWAAAYASGTAVKVEDPAVLDRMDGQSY